VIGINGIESSFNGAIGSLKNDLAFFVPPNVFKNMCRGVLQPILRPTGFSQLCLLEMHNLFNHCAEQPLAASSMRA